MFDIVPWLMLASTMRFIGWRGGTFGLVTTVLSDLFVFIAFLLGARAMIEWTGGRMQIGRAGFREQLALAHKILLRVFVLLVAATVIVGLLGSARLGPSMMMGFDGIAFDQFSKLGRIWSAVLAAVAFMLVVTAETSGQVMLGAALRALARHAGWMVPAIAAIALLQFGLSGLQGVARAWVYALWQSAAPEMLKNFVYFFFVFGFASLRVWLTLAILTLALRESYRRRGPVVAIRPRAD
ncbi:MAG: hypothetical protein F9K38_08430 [Pseudorhodoplanes sp.]|nr:MAG: hypothetical protein F9K38_08430 [Pseudorhodoplanes sp.]